MSVISAGNLVMMWVSAPMVFLSLDLNNYLSAVGWGVALMLTFWNHNYG